MELLREFLQAFGIKERQPSIRTLTSVDSLGAIRRAPEAQNANGTRYAPTQFANEGLGTAAEYWRE
jgi:hypothetical protein